MSYEKEFKEAEEKLFRKGITFSICQSPAMICMRFTIETAIL